MAVPNKTMFAKILKTLKGIMVRIVVVATTKIDANSAPAVPACSAR